VRNRVVAEAFLVAFDYPHFQEQRKDPAPLQTVERDFTAYGIIVNIRSLLDWAGHVYRYR
jgi:hypothetical protein